MNPRQIALIFWSRKGLILTVLAVAILSAFVVASMLKPRYTATAQLYVNLADPNGATGNQVPPAVVRNYVLTQIEAIRSRGLALAVVERDNLAADPAWRSAFAAAGGAGDIRDFIAGQLQNGLTVLRQAASDIITVTYNSGDADASARMANSFAAAHLRKDVEMRASPAQELARWYEERLKQLRERLTQVETERSQLRFEAIRRGDADATGTPDPLSSLPTVYANARNAVTDARAALDKARNGQNPPAENPELVALRRQASDTDMALKRDLPLLGPQHRRIQNLRANLDQTNGQIETAVRRLRADALADRTRELAAAEQRRDEIAAQMTREEGQRNEQSRSRAAAAALDRELDGLRGQIDTMVQRREKAFIEGASTAGNVSILSLAAVPQQPSWPRLAIILPVAAGLGLAFGLAFAFLREMTDRRVRCTDDLTNYFEAPLLGVVPRGRLSRAMAQMPLPPARPHGWRATPRLAALGHP